MVCMSRSWLLGSAQHGPSAFVRIGLRHRHGMAVLSDSHGATPISKTGHSTIMAAEDIDFSCQIRAQSVRGIGQLSHVPAVSCPFPSLPDSAKNALNEIGGYTLGSEA